MERSIVKEFSINGVDFQLVFDVLGAQVFLVDPNTGDLTPSESIIGWNELDVTRRRVEAGRMQMVPPSILAVAH